MTEINKEHWRLFLKDLAHEAGFTKAQLNLFLCRFSLENEGKKQSEIINILKDKDFKIKDDFYGNHFKSLFTALKDLSLKENRSRWIDNLKIEYIESTEIISKGENSREIENEMLKINKLTKEGSIWKGLRSAYPSWQKERQVGIVEPNKSIKELWIQLKELGTYAPERMGVYEEGEDEESNIATMGIASSFIPQAFSEKVSSQKNPRLRFKIIKKGMGQVLLLNYGGADVVICICPSQIAASTALQGGEKVVPEPEFQPFKAEGKKEEWWCWIVDEMPELSWLNNAKNAAFLQLNAKQLAELLSKVELQQGEVLHTFYWVI